MALIKSSDLDFDTIKANLKTHLQAQSEFSDYNFEASGLSNILDVLAYNTHLNALTANVAINESFLGSAQLRSSVVTHAETLGYYPRSMTGATAVVNLKVTTTDTTSGDVTLPENTKFTTTIDDVSYTFQTLATHTASNNNGVYDFKTSDGSADITITEGSQKTKTFLVGDTADNQVYVIPDTTIDTSTIVVKVFDTPTSSTFTAYTDIQKSVRINTTSTIFIVREVPNGYYELTFSDGNVLGKAPEAGNKIEVTYLSVKGADANLASTFAAQSQVTIGGTDYTMAVTTSSKSSGGDNKETIDSIKSNAPVAFASQQRLVTAEDYKALILQRYSSTVQDVIAWGGNDNVPPIYGRVYVALKFKTGVTTSSQTAVKDSIKNNLALNLGVMSIDTVYTDPDETFLELATTFNFDPDLTGDTINAMQDKVKTAIATFFDANLDKFGGTFRKSLVLATIDAISPAVLDSKISVKAQQRFVPTLNTEFTTGVNFPIKIANPDDENHTVITTNFTFNGKTCFIRNKLKETKLELIDNATSTVELDNAGSYDAGTGVVTLSGLTISAYEGAAIKISVTPADQDTIKPLRNYILKIDADKSSEIGVTDFQNTAITLST